jgi:hypothetical protein
VIRLQAAVVANAASVDATGLVSMLGAFVDTVNAPSLPFRQQLWVVARLLLDEEDRAQPHTTTLVVEHSDGTEPVARIEAAMQPTPDGRTFDPLMPVGAPVVFPLQLEFRRRGIYVVRLVVDGEALWETPLKVRSAIPNL